mmetsp:Transcript_10830/g.24790  ORF Transcript_10830/g.24790 Transcript_10830/m.24790 type:complete len:596 (-) Transcript_10830:61-1848(-)
MAGTEVLPDDLEALRSLRSEIAAELSGMLESLPVKMLKDFRADDEVNRATESAAVAASCLVSGIEQSLEVPGDQPPQTWKAVQVTMSKPGHFISALRRFPYAVDSGRLPSLNASAAEVAIKDVTPELIGDEPVARLLCRWVRLALKYCKVRDRILLLDPTSVQMQELGSPEKGSATSSSAPSALPQAKLAPFAGSPASADSSSQSAAGAATSIASRLFGAGFSVPGLSRGAAAPEKPPAEPPLVPEVPSAAAPARSGAEPGAGPCVMASRSAAQAGPPPPKKSSRPAGSATSPSPKPVVPKLATDLKKGPPAKAVTAARPTASSPAKAPPKKAAAPQPRQKQMMNFTAPARPRQVPLSSSLASAPVGRGIRAERPHGPLQRVSSADLTNADLLKAKVEQLRRETREMKAAEHSLKWSMQRQERQVKVDEKVRDAKDIMAWRREQVDESQAYADANNRVRRQSELTENRNYQEFKRDRKQVLKEEDLEDVKERYQDGKDYSEWAMALRREMPMEERAQIVEANIENFKMLQDYHYEEERQRKIEYQVAAAEEQRAEMNLLIHQAKREHAAAQNSLDGVKIYVHHPIPMGAHMMAKP